MQYCNSSVMATLLQQKNNCMKQLIVNGTTVVNTGNTNSGNNGGVVVVGQQQSQSTNLINNGAIIQQNLSPSLHHQGIITATSTRMLLPHEMVHSSSIPTTIIGGNMTTQLTTSGSQILQQNQLTGLISSTSTTSNSNTLVTTSLPAQYDNFNHHLNHNLNNHNSHNPVNSQYTRYFSQFSNNSNLINNSNNSLVDGISNLNNSHILNSSTLNTSLPATNTTTSTTINKLDNIHHHHNIITNQQNLPPTTLAQGSNINNAYGNTGNIIDGNNKPKLNGDNDIIKCENYNDNKELNSGADATISGITDANPIEEQEPEPEIDIVINNVVCSFSVRCHLNLRDIALNGFNVEFRRENGMVTMKLRRPYTTASIWSSGRITCTGATSEDQAKIAARRYARCLQKLGFNVHFRNFRVVNVLGTCSMPWAIKIVNFSEKFKKEASYEPELHPGVTYKLKYPKATLKIFSTGSITVTAASVAHVQNAIEHIFPLVYEFRKKRSPQDLELLRVKQEAALARQQAAIESAKRDAIRHSLAKQKKMQGQKRKYPSYMAGDGGGSDDDSEAKNQTDDDDEEIIVDPDDIIEEDDDI